MLGKESFFCLKEGADVPSVPSTDHLLSNNRYKESFFGKKEGADVPSVPSTDHLVSENRYKKI